MLHASWHVAPVVGHPGDHIPDTGRPLAALVRRPAEAGPL
jgi:hypothetical protein